MKIELRMAKRMPAAMNVGGFGRSEERGVKEVICICVVLA